MIATILLQATGGNGTQTMIMFGLIAIVFYFFMIIKITVYLHINV